MADELTQFDDPLLRDAIRRVRGAHVARSELVERVRERLMAELSGADGPAPHGATPALAGRPPAARGRAWFIGRWLAVAAAIVLAFVLGMQVERVQHEAHERVEYLEMNRELFREMIAAHTGADADTAKPEPLAVAGGPASAREQAAAKLSRFVPLPDLAAQGWKLESAALRQFHASPIASFVFARPGGGKVTLLSMPANLYAFARDGETYETTVDGHPIAGFIRGGGVHCVVGDASTPLSDVAALNDALRKQS